MATLADLLVQPDVARSRRFSRRSRRRAGCPGAYGNAKGFDPAAALTNLLYSLCIGIGLGVVLFPGVYYAKNYFAQI